MTWLPYFLAVFSVAVKVDPYYYIFQEPMPQINIFGQTLSEFHSIPIRTLMLLIYGNEVGLVITTATIYSMLFYAVLNDFHCSALAWYKRRKCVANALKVIRLYNQLQIAHIINSPICEHLITSAMGIGFGLFIVCNFATIKLMTIIPFPIFVTPPITSAILLFISKAIINLGLQSHDSSSLLLKELKITSQTAWTRGHLRRRLASLKPMVVHLGVNGYRIFKFVKTTKSTYDFAIVTYSIDALISVPISKFMV